MLPGAHSGEFVWATGIEDTFVPQSRAGHRALDEYALMGHYEHWREDLAPARELGVQAIRWGIPWYRVEPQQGVFDWSWIDQVLPYLVEELGITPIVDLMHYGCPLWLQDEFANEQYPRAVASYAAEFARRYSGLVRWYTPLNEPLVNAAMCGWRGAWPPYLRGDAGFVRIMLQLARGILETVEAIRHIDPDAVMVHVDAAGLSRAGQQELETLAEEDRLRRFLCYDLLIGALDSGHPLSSWLAQHGASRSELASMDARRISLDIIGLNFYPQWSTRELYLNRNGRPAYRLVERDGAGFAELMHRYWERYRVPIMVTETSARGSDHVRSAWLGRSLAAIKEARAAGVPVIGYTWFPMLTMIDWRYRRGRRPLEEYRLELGLYRLHDGVPRWAPTPLVEQFRAYVADTAASVGKLRAHSGGTRNR